MFDSDISTFETFDSAPVTISLSRWIRSTINSNCKFAQQVKRYRKTDKEYVKKSLPLATIGAICEGGRKGSDVVERTGWIALDVDAKDNPQLKDAAHLRDQIANISYVAFAGLSVSGQGVWALVKVADPQKQDKYFQQLQTDFKSLGIILDSSKGMNANDARFYSFDPNAYVAKDFKVYNRLPKKEPVKKPRPTSREIKPSLNGNITQDRVEALISKIQTRGTDITAGHDNWIDLGFALEDEFGESGREYFHAISQYHSDYTRRECDWQYTKCLEHTGKGVGIGTFFHRCKEYDIILDRYHKPRRDNGLESKYEDDNPAPYGFNPWTGEVFDKREYPSEWDTVSLDEVSTIRQYQLN